MKSAKIMQGRPYRLDSRRMIGTLCTIKVQEDWTNMNRQLRMLDQFFFKFRGLSGYDVIRRLLCCSSTDPQHTLLCPQAGGAVFGRVAGFVTTRLRQCHTRRPSGIPDRSAAVRVERRRPGGLLITEVRSRDASSSWAALAEDESADRL